MIVVPPDFEWWAGHWGEWWSDDQQGPVHSGSIGSLTPLREGEPVPPPKPPIGFRLRDKAVPE